MTTTIGDSRPDSTSRWFQTGPGRRARSAEATVIGLFARFALTGLVAVLIIGAVTFVLVRRTATSASVAEATRLARLAGRGIAEPSIDRAVLAGDPAALAQLDRVVRQRILVGTPIVRVKIWDEHGRVVYSDAKQLIGSVFPLGAAELRTLRDGGTDSDASDLTRPESRTERGFRRLIEVYVGIRGPDNTRLLYEDYERSSTISSSSRQQWEALLPALGGALLVLYLIQIPLAFSLARRLQDKQRERERLLQRAIDASDLERRRIAADLHDGAVQRLAGVSLSLAAASSPRAVQSDARRLSGAIAEAASETRETIRELRTLLVDIYPPTLQRSGLEPALSDIVAPLVRAGVEVTLRVPPALDLPDATEALLYRVTQEAIRNVRTHGHATAVDVDVEVDAGTVWLTVTDNGRGFSLDELTSIPRPDHFGLRLMRDLVDHAGGDLDVSSAPGEGTSVCVAVRLR